MWHQWFNHYFMKLWEYFLFTKKTQITTTISSILCQSSTRIHDSTTMHACTFLCLQTSRSTFGFYVRMPAPALAAPHVVIFVFFVHKKYSSRFIKLQMNHLCHIRTCLCRVRKLSDFIKNILICVPKMKEGLKGIVHPKIKILSLNTHPHVIPNP